MTDRKVIRGIDIRTILAIAMAIGAGAVVMCGRSYFAYEGPMYRTIVAVLAFALASVGGVFAQKLYSTPKKILIGAFSLLFSLALTAQKNIAFSGNNTDSYTVNRFLGIGGDDVAMTLAMFLVIYLAACGLMSALNKLAIRLQGYQAKGFSSLVRPFTVGVRKYSFIILMLGWSVFWLTYFPWTGISDTIRILNGPIQMSVQHRFVYNLIISTLYNIGYALGNENMTAGAALVGFLQLVYCAVILSYCIDWFSRKGFPAFMVIAIQFYFAFSPDISNIALAGVKDAPFSFTTLLFLPLLYDAWESGGDTLLRPRNILLFLYASFMTVWLRSNGVFVVAAVCIAMPLFFRRYWRQMAAIALIAVITPYALNDLAMDKIVKREMIVSESLAVPLQQIAMTVVSGGVITEKQGEVIDAIMPREEIANYYAPASVDTLKWGKGATHMDKNYLQDHVSLFLKTWAEMLFPNLDSYVRAYLLLTHGYWAIDISCRAQSFYYQMTNLDGLPIKIEHVQILPKEVENKLKVYYGTSTSDAPAVGTMLWLFLLLGLYMICFGRGKLIVVYMPVFMIWLTLMLSAPINTCLRYHYAMLIYLPFCIWLPFRNPVSFDVGPSNP